MMTIHAGFRTHDETGKVRMLSFNLLSEQAFNPERHVEKVLGLKDGGDYTVACWEPGQISPYHCHPNAVEVYFCYEGGGSMRTPEEVIAVVPGAFVVHPRGEVHEYINGPQRSVLFRVRYGDNMSSRVLEWPSNRDWKANTQDMVYFTQNPIRRTG
jgi:quercetin dioxygenase-like cupin family protein